VKVGSYPVVDFRVTNCNPTETHHSSNVWYEVLTRAGRGDANSGNETSAPVKDRVGEVGVYVGSIRATFGFQNSKSQKFKTNFVKTLMNMKNIKLL